MSFAKDFGPPKGQLSGKEKMETAAGAFGNTPNNSGKPAKKGHKFHGMDITAAENGVSIRHTIKKFKNAEKTRGAQDTPVNPSSSGPWGDETTSKTHVLGNDDPMMAHVNALHEHFSSNSPDED